MPSLFVSLIHPFGKMHALTQGFNRSGATVADTMLQAIFSKQLPLVLFTPSKERTLNDAKSLKDSAQSIPGTL